MPPPPWIPHCVLRLNMWVSLRLRNRPPTALPKPAKLNPNPYGREDQSLSKRITLDSSLDKNFQYNRNLLVFYGFFKVLFGSFMDFLCHYVFPIVFFWLLLVTSLLPLIPSLIWLSLSLLLMAHYWPVWFPHKCIDILWAWIKLGQNETFVLYS